MIVPGKSLTLGIRSDSTLQPVFLGVAPNPDSFDSDLTDLGVALTKGKL
jgi:hypothetical protein